MRSLVVAICALFVIAAMVLGVGLASDTVLRHVVQTAPFWIVVALGFRRSGATSSVALPLFVFWLVLMALIWTCLLDIAHFLSGNFSPVEIAMTVIVGMASVIGIASRVRGKSSLPPAARIGAFVVLAIGQFICFRVSFLPAIAHR